MAADKRGSTSTTVTIDGHRLSLSNLDKVLYPEAGFTKGEVIDYYTRIAPALVAHIGDRGISMKRFPDGVDGGFFWEKRCPSHRPEWVGTAVGPGDRSGDVQYCVLADRASLVWAANLAALEIHAPMARARDIETPTMVVFDLDPGPGTDIGDCAEIALWIREVLAGVGLEAWAKTSGSKGMQLYVPVNRPGLSHHHASSFAHAVAQAMEKHHGDRVTSVMRKDLRHGKVFIDWSQNSRHKTTVAPYSLRARPRPTVSTPVTWEEVEEAADGAPLSFEAGDVLGRLDEHGDVFADVARLEQDFPALKP
ncbi:MAG: non-homologous end-joining DNA ligase [Acidimicrobiales bacterium]